MSVITAIVGRGRERESRDKSKMSQESSASSSTSSPSDGGGSGHDPGSIQLILDAINDHSPTSENCNLPAAASSSSTDQVGGGNTRASPPADIFRNLRNAQRFSIDIGGSLAKIAYFSKVLHRRVKINDGQGQGEGVGGCEEFTYEVLEGARLHFIKFETQYIEECLDFVQKRLMGSIDCMRGKCVKVTGGGAYKYSALIQEKLGITPDKEDELGCLIKGANFLLKNVANEAFSYERKRDPEYHFMQAGPVLFPYLLVNIGSGVSILKVDSETEFQRVGGTATGGGTFWGLGKLLTGAKEFDELLELAEQGDNRSVDLLVKDIYSRDYAQMGLPGDLIASSFGKATWTSNSSFKPADLARSLLFTIANDIGQIACLFALQHKLSRIYFGGYFLRNHPLSMSAVSYSVQFWSKKTVEALFLRHEGYLGAIGAFLRGTEELEPDKYSWSENFSGSSGCLINGLTMKKEKSTTTHRPFFRRGSIEQLEIDRLEQPIGFFPLLLPPDQSYLYTPDTVDLTIDSEARLYWLNCFEGWIEKITSRAIESQPNHPTTADRALRCRHKLQSRLKLLHKFPCAFGTLTVRSLLDTVEQALRESDFPDPYFSQKSTENLAALGELGARLSYIDSLPLEERERELILGVLAGNVFDWGAKAVTQLLEGPDLFGFDEAKQKIQTARWVVDCMEEWKERLANGPKHKCVAIFVDNSGFDFVLGIMPFAREFLKRGTKVILCPNSQPAVNDITYPEMVSLIVNHVAHVCPIINSAFANEQLTVVSTGQASPCLDLSRVSQDLILAVEENETDLVVIEGMGRSIHTNLNAKFRVDVLKMAVIKNAWLAERLGGELYSALFKYEKANEA